jgi:hypothetical protein
MTIQHTITGVGFCNVKNYGAVGDGVTDDTAAIQAAFDEATGGYGSNHGGYPGPGMFSNRRVYFPNGHYIITAPIEVYQVEGLRVNGAGKYATTIEQTTANAHVFFTDGSSRMRWEDFSVVCAAGYGVGISCSWYSNPGDVVNNQENIFVNITCHGGGAGIVIGGTLTGTSSTS